MLMCALFGTEGEWPFGLQTRPPGCYAAEAAGKALVPTNVKVWCASHLLTAERRVTVCCRTGNVSVNVNDYPSSGSPLTGAVCANHPSQQGLLVQRTCVAELARHRWVLPPSRQIDPQSLLQLNVSLCFMTLEWLVPTAVHKVAFLEQLLVIDGQAALALTLLRHYSTVRSSFVDGACVTRERGTSIRDHFNVLSEYWDVTTTMTSGNETVASCAAQGPFFSGAWSLDDTRSPLRLSFSVTTVTCVTPHEVVVSASDRSTQADQTDESHARVRAIVDPFDPRLTPGDVDTRRHSVGALLSVPIVIIAFNNPTYVRQMVARCRRLSPDVRVFDNGSTFPGMVALLDHLDSESGVSVYRFPVNHGHLVVEKLQQVLPPQYVQTDPDLLLPDGMTNDTLLVLADLGLRFGVYKAGVALDVSETDALWQSSFYYQGLSIADWEQQFWQRRYPDTLGLEIYDGFIDTTFAVVTSANHIRVSDCCIRVAGPSFTTKHLPWYRQPIVVVPGDELAHFRRTQICSTTSLLGVV